MAEPAGHQRPSQGEKGKGTLQADPAEVRFAGWKAHPSQGAALDKMVGVRPARLRQRPGHHRLRQTSLRSLLGRLGEAGDGGRVRIPAGRAPVSSVRASWCSAHRPAPSLPLDAGGSRPR